MYTYSPKRGQPVGAKDYARRRNKVKCHGKMPLRVHWRFPVKIDWESD